MYKPPHLREFSKNSKNYKNYSFLQKKVAKKLINYIDFKPKKILDLGCGDGAIISLIDWEFDKFVGVDFSQGMLKLHQKGKNIYLIEKDFDTIDKEFYKKFDLVISSSSLQWSNNISKIILDIQENAKFFGLAIFCDGTFKNMREWLGLETFLPNKKELISLFKLDKDIFYETVKFYIKFDDAIDQLRYIKKSGVSGGIKKVSVKKIRSFIKNYHENVLEFEVLFMLKTP